MDEIVSLPQKTEKSNLSDDHVKTGVQNVERWLLLARSVHIALNTVQGARVGSCSG